MSPTTREEVESLKEKIHHAAKTGRAISIFAVLWNMDKQVVREILEHVTEEDGQRTTPLVIAALQGETKVIQVLLMNFTLNLEQRCVVRFDGYIIQDATALWCASGAGHLDIVKMLIQCGAKVNGTTATNSTPLRAACFDGHLDVVRYLIEMGADLSIPNKYNNNCLMISSYKGHTAVVRHLLEKGANPNLRAHCGATALHFASECGHLGVVGELIFFNACMLTNDMGMTPLMVAAESGSEIIVDFFLSLPNCSRMIRVEALELLGASFANDKETYDLSKTYKYLHQAMACRNINSLVVGTPAKIPKPPCKPVAAYDHHIECQNLEQLHVIRNNQDALHMEALTIRERILGSKNPELPHPIIFRGAVYADQGRFDRCTSLWMHALNLRQKNHRSINKDLLRFSQVFSQMLTMGVDLVYEDIEDVIRHGMVELQIFFSTCRTGGSREVDCSSLHLFQGNILSMIYLIKIALIAVGDDKQHIASLYRIIYLFLQNRSCLKNGYSPLHIILDPSSCVDDFHVNSVVRFPDLQTVEVFLECGADVGALDHQRNTPLHIISKAHLVPYQECVRLDIIKLLIEKGAHIDQANRNWNTPCDVARGRSYVTLIAQKNVHMSLKCLAARAVSYHGIPYVDQIPKSLYEFVERH